MVMEEDKCEKDSLQDLTSAVRKEGKVRFATATFYIFARTEVGGEDDFQRVKHTNTKLYSRPKEKMKTSEKNDVDGLKKTLKEHFIYSARERVTYTEIVETFLPYERWFKCFNQRDVIRAIQSVFKGVIAKPSSKESVVFLNLSKKAESEDLGEVIDTYSVNLESSETVERKMAAVQKDTRKPLQASDESLDCVTSAFKSLTVVETSMTKIPGKCDDTLSYCPTFCTSTGSNSGAVVQNNSEDVTITSANRDSDVDLLKASRSTEKVPDFQKKPTRRGKRRINNANEKVQDSAVNPKQSKKIPKITPSSPYSDPVSLVPGTGTFGTGVHSPSKRSLHKRSPTPVVKTQATLQSCSPE